MAQLSKNFTSEEFACQCGCGDEMNKYIDKYAVIVNSDTNEGLLVSNCYVFTDWELHEFEDEEAARDYIEENGIILKEELYEDLYQQDH